MQKVLQAEQERLEMPDETGATMTACLPPQFLEQLLEETLSEPALVGLARSRARKLQ